MGTDSDDMRDRIIANGVPIAARLLSRTQGLTAALITPDAAGACRRLLYRVYHDELGWRPEPGNPSNLRIAQSAEPEFVDDYDSRAVWIALRDARTVVATARVLLPDPAVPLEVARYHPIPDEILDGAMEVNRLAIERRFRSGPALAVIALTLAAIGRTARVRRGLIAVQEPISRAVFRPLQWRYTGVTFRYHPSDRHACEVLAMDAGGRQLAIALMKAVATRARTMVSRAPKTPDRAS